MKKKSIIALLLAACCFLAAAPQWTVPGSPGIPNVFAEEEGEEPEPDIGDDTELDTYPDDWENNMFDDISDQELLEEMVEEARYYIIYVQSMEATENQQDIIKELQEMLTRAEQILQQERISDYRNQANRIQTTLERLLETMSGQKHLSNRQGFGLMINDDNVDLKIGEPYVRYFEQGYPSLIVVPYYEGTLEYDVIFHHAGGETEVLYHKEPWKAEINLNNVVKIPLQLKTRGWHEVRFKLNAEGQYPYYDSIHFYAQAAGYHKPAGSADSLFVDETGALQYVPDYKGNHIMDYSTVGYEHGEKEPPIVEEKVTVSPSYSGDDWARIQAAIDKVSAMPLDENGFRGAVVLKQGVYQVSKTLNINASGVVLRGEYCENGAGEPMEKAVIRSTQNSETECVLIDGGKSISVNSATSVGILNQYVPFGCDEVFVENTRGYQVGDSVVVRVSFDMKWIQETGHDLLVRDGESQAWPPFSVDFERMVTGVTENTIQLDVPIATNIDSKLQTGEIIRCTENRIEHTGVENIQFVAGTDILSATGDSKMETSGYFISEERASCAVCFNNVKNAWARDLDIQYFDKGVMFGRGAKYCTGRDLTYRVPSSIITGGRRYPFYTEGQSTLFTRCTAQDARHAYSLGSRVPGPNVFHRCYSTNNYGLSEPHHRWSMGGLYDNVQADLGLYNRQSLGTGHGWAAAWYVAWNTENALTIQTPPTAQNYSIGHVGTTPTPPYTTDMPQHFELLGTHASLESLYEYELEQRIGKEQLDKVFARAEYPVVKK